MESKRGLTSAEEALAWIREKEDKLVESEFGTNLHECRRALEAHDHVTGEIAAFSSDLHRLSKHKVSSEAVGNMETSYSALKELSEDRQKCLETLLYIAEIEEYYQTLAAEVDSRALQLTPGPCPADNDAYSNDHQGAEASSKAFNACIYAVRNTWSWLAKASHCMEIHLKNAAAYHQFFHEVKHCDQSLRTITTQLHKQLHKIGTDVSAFTREVRETIKHLLNCQVKVETLFRMSGDIVPLHLRKDPVEKTIKITALVQYYQKEMAVSENEQLTLLDNSQTTKWKVRNNKGCEALLPAIVFLIPPPDRDAVHNSQRVRQQLLSTWRDSLHLIKQHAQKYFTSYFSAHQRDELKTLKPGMRTDIIQCLEDMKMLLAPSTSHNVDTLELRSVAAEWQNSVKEMKGTVQDRRGLGASLQMQWKANQKLIRQIEEMVAYSQSYHEDFDRTRNSEELLVRDANNEVKFQSSAYIERMKPAVELEDIPEEEETYVQHMTISEKVPILPEPDIPDSVMITTTEEWGKERNADKDHQEFSSQTIRETQTFVIVGVVDPRNEETVSIYRAINEGIISQTQGVYRNPANGDSMPIPEAMNRGKILVEYVNKSVEEGAIERGVITTTTTTETVSYSVTQVVDPVTGKPISVEEAVKRGIIDQATGLYINPVTGESMPLTEAIEQGLVDVVSEDRQIHEDEPDSVEYIDKDFVVSGVVDPRTGKVISLEKAIREGIIDPKTGQYLNPVTGDVVPLMEAIRTGLVRAREFDPRKDKNNPNVLHASVPESESRYVDKDFVVSGVMDPRSGKIISLEKAVSEGIINPATGEYRDPLTGETMPLMEAVRKGLVKGREFDPQRDKNNSNVVHARVLDTDELPDKFIDKDFVVSGVVDPRTGRTIPLEKAIREGIIDPETGKYHDPITGETMSLMEALRKGLVKAHEFDPIRDKNSRNVLHAKVLESEDLVDGEGEVVDVNHSIYNKMKDRFDPNMPGIREECSGKELTVGEAFEEGVLHMDPLHIENSNQDRYSLVEASVSGLVEPITAKALVRAFEPLAMDRLIEDHQLNTDTGRILDPHTRRGIPLLAAIEEEVIDPDMVFYTDVPSQNITSLSTAIEHKKLDPKTGKVFDPKTGQELTIAQAINKHIIDPKVDAEKLGEQISALKLLGAHMDMSVKGVKNTLTGDMVSVEEAVLSGILDIPRADYVNLANNQSMSIPEAVDAKLIDPEVAKDIFGAMSENSLTSSTLLSLIDPNTGKFTHPETKRKMTIKEAIDAGLFDPNSVFVVDPSTGKVKSLTLMIEEGRFNPNTGKFKDPLTGLEVSMANALKKGIIKTDIDPEHIIEEKCSVQDLMSRNKGNAHNIVFVAPDGQQMSLKEALANGFLTPDSMIKVDPDTGCVTISGEDDILQALVDTKKNLDWVTGIETTIAKQGPPKEKIDEIKEQIAAQKNLKKNIDQHNVPVSELLHTAQELLDNNRDAKKNPGTQQQYQRLRFNTSDLKLRFEEVNNQADTRLQRLEDMRDDLSSFHDKMDDLDSWLENAGRELEDIKQAITTADETEEILETFKEFNQDAIAKENQLQVATRVGQNFIEKSKEYGKEAEKFRGSLQQKVVPSREEPSHLIEKEIKGVNNKFKEVLRDCDSLMAKLSDTASKNRLYNELKDKLARSLPTLETRMEGCDPDLQPGMDPSRQLDELNTLTVDVIAEGKAVDDMRKTGQDIIAILEELDCADTPKARAILSDIEEFQAKFDHVQEGVVDKQHKLNDAVVRTQDAGHNVDVLLQWVNETEMVFDDMKPVSLNKDLLNEQIQAHRVLVSDIESHKAMAESLAQQVQGAPGMDERVEHLMDRFDILESRAQQRGSHLEDVIQRLGTLHGNVGQLESWLGSTVNSLKRESADVEPRALKDKIEKLYQQKQGKQKDLDTIKVIGQQLVEDPLTGDKNHLREKMADVQGKWHDLTELLVQMISFAALKEIDDLLKYLDKAENDINTAEAISTDPETLAVQLRDHKAFHEDLESKRRAVNGTIDKCNKMLRETTNEEADDIKNKLTTIRNQADLVCKLSSERLALLEEALPLASHFSETHADLQSWLGEIEAEIDSLEVPTDGNAEQIRKQQENAKTTQRIIEDHKPLVEDLSTTGNELMEMCTDEDASDLKEDIDNVNAKYDDVKTAVREKLNDIDEGLRSVTSDVGDTIDGLLEELHYLSDQVEHADPIAANPDSLREQIIDNNTILDDLGRRQPAIERAKEDVRAMLETQTPENAEECEDLRSKLQDLDCLQDNIIRQTQDRGAKLEEAIMVAERFNHDYTDVIRALRDIQDNLLSQDSPGVDPSTIEEQQKELQSIQAELEHAMPALIDCRQTADHLATLAGTPGRMELQKHLEDIESALEEIDDGVKERSQELNSAMNKATSFDRMLQSIMSWLPKAEDRLVNMQPVAGDPRSVRIQIEEMKVYNVGVKPRFVDIQGLNQYASELKNASPVTAESLSPQVKDINSRWNKLLKGIQDREQKLQDTLVTMGEVDHALEDVIGFLTETESELQGMDDVYGDPKCIETQIKKVQLLIKDMKAQEPTIRKLNHVVDDMVARSGHRNIPAKERQEEMNELYQSVMLSARDRQNQLQDVLKEVKAFMGDVEDVIRWFTDFRNQLRSSSPMGALPDTAQKQFDKFTHQYQEMQRKEDEVHALMLNGEDMLARCRDGEAQQLRDNFQKLQEKMQDTREKAERRKHKLEEHLVNVQDFHAMLKIHTDWLSNAEKILGSFKYPSKLVDRALNQIREHKSFKEDIEGHREIMTNLDRTGTYLKYFGRKQDTVYIKNLLISIKLRWKKLVRRADEKGRLLQQAFKEDKRFYDAWKGLCDWLEDSERRLKKYTNAGPAKVKQDIDELKMFQHQLSARHPQYYSTMRLGRSLKDRCTKSDPERDILQNMLEDLKNKWSITRSIVSQRQNKLDEALLSSGRFSDALQSLLEWLGKAEAYLAEDQPILGDLDTITILTDQHKAFQQELESRQGVVHAMKATPNPDAALSQQIDELTGVWARVNQLSEVREARLHEAQKLAEDFNESVQVVREWLPHAEAELKFKALPEDEDLIVELIERHEKFQEQLRGQQPNIERIKYLAEEILSSCHPNAVRFVKYYLTITQTRWEQAINRSNQRAQRLQEALRSIRGNAALVEELLAWLMEAQALLSTKEKDHIPEDLTVVEALVRQHLEFHDDLQQKNKDAERLTKLPTTSERKRQLHGSQYKLNEPETAAHRVITLQTRWRNVWRMSVDRKKKLQDALDHLLELESFKNFDFELWRQRYLSWVRAKKFRITDFFRRQDKDGDGALNRKEFVEGMLASKFPTNRTELNAVFDIFDKNGSAELDYQEFVNALRPDRSRKGKRQLTDAELVHDEIEQQVSHCQCRQQFKVQKVGEGKYKMGEKGKLCLVRFLNNTVMVRVGGGWVTLAGFLENNDPCKATPGSSVDKERQSDPKVPTKQTSSKLPQAKGRTNTELREQFFLPDGASQARQAFVSNRRKSSTPVSNGPGSRTPGQGSLTNSPSVSSSLSRNSKLSGSTSSLTSAGKASSKGGGNLAASKRSHLAASWSNLSSPSLSTPRRQQFGSTSDLHSTPRRGGRTPSSTNSPSQHTSKRKMSTPGSATRSRGGVRTNNNADASGSNTPTSQRSLSPVPSDKPTTNGNVTPSKGANERTVTGRKTPTSGRRKSAASVTTPKPHMRF